MNAPFSLAGDVTKIIRVLNGRLAGAEHRLHSGKFVRIGHSFDHDVVLRGKTTQGVSLELHLLNDISTIKIVSGKVRLLGRDVDAGQSAQLPFYLPVHVGEFAFAVGDPVSDRWSEAQDLHTRIGVADEAVAENTAEAPAAALTVQASPMERLSTRFYPLKEWAERPRDWARIGMIAASVFLVALAAGPVWSLIKNQISGPEQRQTMLATIGFQHLKVTKDEATGQQVITGTLRSDSDLTKLRQYALANMPDTRVEVETTEGHAAAAKEILASQGIAGEVKPAAIGALSIVTEFLPKDRQDALAKLLKQDLPAVKTVNFSVNNALGERDLQYFFASGPYGLATYVDGDPSYISTADGTKWFIGSELPTGHKILAMGEGRIRFEREGRVEELVM